MPPRRMQFTIRSLMIGVLAAAVLFALPSEMGLRLLAFAAPCAAFFMFFVGALWFRAHASRRVAGLCFGVGAGLANGGDAALCVHPNSLVLVLLVVTLLFATPAIASLGVAWATLATRPTAIPRRSAVSAWLLVFGLAVAPSTMMFTLWPLRLAFLVSSPALNRLA